MGIKKNTVVRGCLVPSLKNKPLDGRQDVPTLADIVNIENPYVNFIFPVAETGKWYKVISLRTKVMGDLEIPDGEIDKYDLFGEGLTEEEKQKILFKDLAEQIYLKKEDAEESYLTKEDAIEDYQPKGNYQPQGDYATKEDLRNAIGGIEIPEEVHIGTSEPTDDSKLWVDTSVTPDGGGNGGGSNTPGGDGGDDGGNEGGSGDGGDNGNGGVTKYENLIVNVSADKDSVTGFEVLISEENFVGASEKYLKLDYIESTGTQYIDTGFTPNQDTRVVAKIECIVAGDINWAFGARTKTKQDSFGFVASSNGSYASQYGTDSGNIDGSYNSETSFIIDKNKNITYINEDLVLTSIYSEFSAPVNMTLFAGNTNGTITYGKIKLYSCKIYDNGTLVRDYVPAMDAYGVCGLYDAVNDIFVSSVGDNFVPGYIAEKTIAVQKDVTGTYQIEYGKKYVVIANNVGSYIAPEMQKFIASQEVRSVAIVYKYVQITTIRINQNVSDPDSMITRIVNKGGVEAVRANSHRYEGEFYEGVMHLKQLDDNNTGKYLNGSDAKTGIKGYDVFMKLPQFFYKCVESSADVWDFTIAYGGKPDSTYKEWDGKDMIGVYGANVTGNALYSIKGLIGGYVSIADFKTYASARGEGFSLVKWKHHCMMAMLFFTYYNNTNSQKILGNGRRKGASSGSTNSLGMTDSTPSQGSDYAIGVNFWGLEDWWGNYSEFIGNVTCNGNASTRDVWKIEEDNGEIRDLTLTAFGGYAAKLLLGEYLDVISNSDVNASSSTGYCDQNISKSDSSTRYLDRSGSFDEDSENQELGICYVSAFSSSYSNSQYYGTRLAYRGEYIIEQ